MNAILTCSVTERRCAFAVLCPVEHHEAPVFSYFYDRRIEGACRFESISLRSYYRSSRKPGPVPVCRGNLSGGSYRRRHHRQKLYHATPSGASYEECSLSCI